MNSLKNRAALVAAMMLGIGAVPMAERTRSGAPERTHRMRGSRITLDPVLAIHTGKGNFLRQQRRDLDISARQQKRILKAARREQKVARAS